MSNKATQLSRRLIELRKPMSQAEAATWLECSPSLVSSWESGNKVPPLHRIAQYVDRFGGEEDGVLAAELHKLRQLALPHLRRETVPEVERREGHSTLEVLRDIRWLLMDIRDRLPPPPHH